MYCANGADHWWSVAICWPPASFEPLLAHGCPSAICISHRTLAKSSSTAALNFCLCPVPGEFYIRATCFDVQFRQVQAIDRRWTVVVVRTRGRCVLGMWFIWIAWGAESGSLQPNCFSASWAPSIEPAAHSERPAAHSERRPHY